MKTSHLHAVDFESASSRWAPSREPPDYCSREGAIALKEKIEAYWRDRGHHVMVSLQNVGFHPAIRAARFDLRTDMVNGLPRGAGIEPNGARPRPMAVVDLEEDFFEDDLELVDEDF